MKTFAKISLLALMVGASACDIGKLINQAGASAVAVGTVLSTPATEVRGEALAFDAGLSSFDAGFAFDAGITIPAQTLVTLYFGNKGPSLDTAPTGVPGAQVTVRSSAGQTFTLADQGGGNYALTPDAGFAYAPGSTYTFTIVSANQTYVADVEQVPDLERVAAFHPPEGYVDLVAGAPFSFTRPEPPAGKELALGFVNVIPLTQGGQGQPTFTNVPTTPLQFLKLVVAPNDWKKPSVEIPGSAFPERGANYLIILQSVKLGGPQSDNLFTGSALLAGSADIAIVKTR